MIHVVAFSGGKDSAALCLWAYENLSAQDVRYVFCDTGWEHPLTYAYVRAFNEKILDGKLITLKSEKYDGMTDLVKRKKRIASPQARFCTDELKSIPMETYLKSIDDEVTVYQGIRAEESRERACMPESEWSDRYDCEVRRPIINWKWPEVFALLKKYDVVPNLLYKKGTSRVGCFPCIMINHGELRRLTLTMPEVWDRIKALEAAAGRSFFYPNFIPERFHTGFDPKSGKTFPTSDDVKAYIFRKDLDKAMLDAWDNEKPAACMSVYHLCE